MPKCWLILDRNSEAKIYRGKTNKRGDDSDTSQQTVGRANQIWKPPERPAHIGHTSWGSLSISQLVTVTQPRLQDGPRALCGLHTVQNRTVRLTVDEICTASHVVTLRKEMWPLCRKQQRVKAKFSKLTSVSLTSLQDVTFWSSDLTFQNEFHPLIYLE